MTTTNALAFVFQNTNVSKADGMGLMGIGNQAKNSKDFSQILNQLGNPVSTEKNDANVEYSNVSAKKVEETGTVKEVDDTKKPNEEFGKKISEKVQSKQTEKVVDEADTAVVEEFNEEMVSLLCNTFQITPEELFAGMEELGMSMRDLLEPANLATLFVHFGGESSITDILMNEDFQLVKAQIEEFGAILSEKLGVSEESLGDTLQLIEAVINENAQEVNVQEDTPQMYHEVADEAVAVKHNNESDELKNVDNTVDNSVIVEQSEETTNQQTSMEFTDNNEGDEETLTNGLKEDDSAFEVTKGRREVVREDLGEQTIKQTTTIDADGTVVKETVRVVDLQNLVSEVTEYVRLTSGNEFSKIEMQLNPVNLGKMIVEVSSTNGEVTTKIITQTEAGKEAVESNINQMRTNLEQQGVKVAAVEVTVESHAFEQNLQGENSNEQQQLMKEQQEQTRKHHMNLNLNELTLDDLSGLMSEEEMLAVRMMQDSGNTMDLTV